MKAEVLPDPRRDRDWDVSWAEIRTLARAGDGIGAHDVHHVQLANRGPGRPDASAARMWSEIYDIRAIIKAHVGVAPDSMAYVGGGFDAALERLVRKAGLHDGPVHRARDHPDRGTTVRAADASASGPPDDVIDVVAGLIVPGLPTFAARMHGVSDLR